MKFQLTSGMMFPSLSIPKKFLDTSPQISTFLGATEAIFFFFLMVAPLANDLPLTPHHEGIYLFPLSLS